MGAPKTLADLVDAYLDAQIAVLLDADQPLRDGRIDAIHPTRVAIRRLRATLRTFPDVHRHRAADRIAGELRWFAAILGGVRDLDVTAQRVAGALAHVEDRAESTAAAAAVDECVAVRSRAAWVRVGIALGSPRYGALRAMLAEWRDDPPRRRRDRDRAAAEAVDYVEAADRTLARRLHRAARAAATGSPDTAAHAHSARRAGKRHRYAAELALPVLGDRGGALVASRAAMQDVLGEQQDAVVTLGFLAEIASAADAAARPGLDTARRREEQVLADSAAVLASLREDATAPTGSGTTGSVPARTAQRRGSGR